MSYLPFEGDDEFKGRDISSTMDDTSHKLIANVSYSDEDIDQMEETLTLWDMEKINEDPWKMWSVEGVKHDSLMEQGLPLCIEGCELEDEEA